MFSSNTSHISPQVFFIAAVGITFHTKVWKREQICHRSRWLQSAAQLALITSRDNELMQRCCDGPGDYEEDGWGTDRRLV